MRDLPNRHVLNRLHPTCHQFQASTQKHQESKTKLYYLEALVQVEVAEEKLAVPISIKCAFQIELQLSSSFSICIWPSLLRLAALPQQQRINDLTTNHSSNRRQFQTLKRFSIKRKVDIRSSMEV